MVNRTGNRKRIQWYRQQEEKRRNLLAEMEEKILCSGTRSDCCMGRSDVTTESMWQLAVTRPLPEGDMNKLADVYPQNAIATFLDLLADDRNVILERGKKRQRKTINSLRAEVYREIHAGKFDYNKARGDYRLLFFLSFPLFLTPLTLRGSYDFYGIPDGSFSSCDSYLTYLEIKKSE